MPARFQPMTELATFFVFALVLLIQPQHKNQGNDHVLSGYGNLYICLIFALDMASGQEKSQSKRPPKTEAFYEFYLDRMI